MISQDRLQKALTYLAESDEPFAQARGLMEGISKQEKTVLGMVFLEKTGTNQDREYQARTSNEYEEWRVKYQGAVCDYELYRNKRITEAMIVEVWRSLGANRRQAGGNL